MDSSGWNKVNYYYFKGLFVEIMTVLGRTIECDVFAGASVAITSVLHPCASTRVRPTLHSINYSN